MDYVIIFKNQIIKKVLMTNLKNQYLKLDLMRGFQNKFTFYLLTFVTSSMTSQIMQMCVHFDLNLITRKREVVFPCAFCA